MEIITKLEPVFDLLSLVFHWSIIGGILTNGYWKWKRGIGNELIGALSFLIGIVGCMTLQPIVKFVFTLTKADLMVLDGLKKLFSDITWMDIANVLDEYAGVFINSLTLLLAFLLVRMISYRFLTKMNIMNKFTLTRLLDKLIGFIYGIIIAIFMIWLSQIVLYLFMPSNYLRLIYEWFMDIPVNAYLYKINPFIV